MEADCLNMHRVMRTQQPELNYLLPETKTVMQAVKKMAGRRFGELFYDQYRAKCVGVLRTENENKLVERLKR